MRENGLVTIQSRVSAKESARRLLIALKRRGMAVFAHIDHAREARLVGFELRPTDLFIFGYPETQTPLLAKKQILGIDLPERILIWQDERDSVWISFNDPLWTGGRHELNRDDRASLEAVRTSLRGIAIEAGALPAEVA